MVPGVLRLVDTIEGHNMDANEIIAMIQKRRNEFFDAQIAGSADDPLEYSLASQGYRS